jgi:parallel beta-helix repeat protein
VSDPLATRLVYGLSQRAPRSQGEVIFMFVSRARKRLGGSVALAVAVGAVAAGSSAAGPPDTLWASPSGGGTACSAASPCSLAYAVANASPGAIVRAKGGTYTGGIVIDTPLHLVGTGNPVLDNGNTGVGIQITASNSSVDHFTVENSKYEGILVGSSPADEAGDPVSSGTPVSGVTIDHVTVINNDQGFVGPEGGPGTGECTAASFYDCGEGIHFVSVTNSVIANSTVSGNAGGILMTDEFGPTSNNLVEHNTVLDNTQDCGITLASHVAQGVPFPTGPYGFGVSDNTIQYNTADGNGVEGEGGGILMAGGGPGTKVSGNTVTHNEASGNGLAGVVIHLHVPGSDLTDNVITYNRLSNNNLDGDRDFYPYVDTETTDILVASAQPLTGTVIEHNQLSNAYYGIWTLNASASTIDHNQFSNITTEVSSN